VDRPVELIAGEEPRRPGDELELRVEHRVVRLGAVDEPPLEAGALLVTALLPAAEAVARLDRGGLDLLEELVDRLVAERSDADALAAPHPLEREPRALVRLPRARRPLDEEVARRRAAFEDLDERRVAGLVL